MKQENGYKTTYTPDHGFDTAALLPYNLSFFDEGEKTEQPTARKRRKAREEGQVAKSQEVSTALMFLAAFYALRLFAGGIFERIIGIFQNNILLIGNLEMVYNERYFASRVGYMFLQGFLIALPMFIVSMAVGLTANLIQVGWYPTSKPLTPKLNRLNPISGFKRIFSFRALMDLFKSLAKLAAIIAVIYSVVTDEIQSIPHLVDMGLLQSLTYVGNVIINMGINVGIVFIFIALLDFSYARWKHTKDLRMSKQEIKEEYKQTEGNPLIRGKIRQKMREVSMRRMMQSVPQADVIITNPSHYAVALQYNRESLTPTAPVVVAKGVDYLAKRIRELAMEHKIEIVENVELARAIYNTVDIGKEIPPDMYQAVAEILAFVYRLKNVA